MNLTKISHPAAWSGKDLFESSMWQTHLADENFDWSRVSDNTELFSRIQQELEDGSGVVLLKGAGLPDAKESDPKNVFHDFCSQIGTPISQSAAGEKVFSVRNEGYANDDPRARGPNTKKKLSFHTDRCDVIAFLCLQQAKSGGENQVVSSMTLYNEMLQRRPDLLEVLCQPFYYQRHNVDLANEKPFTQQPIFSIYKGHFASNFLRVLINRAYESGEVPAMTVLQREALDYLEDLAAEENLHVTFRQEEGDILLLNNWVTYHRRTEFEDYTEMERRRHLLRVWLSMPNSRPLAPLFAGNYGATEAGAIRGGMRASS